MLPDEKRNDTFFVGNFLMDVFDNNSFSRRSTYEEIFTENSVLIFLQALKVFPYYGYF
jgi:hypothetical protein